MTYWAANVPHRQLYNGPLQAPLAIAGASVALGSSGEAARIGELRGESVLAPRHLTRRRDRARGIPEGHHGGVLACFRARDKCGDRLVAAKVGDVLAEQATSTAPGA